MDYHIKSLSYFSLKYQHDLTNYKSNKSKADTSTLTTSKQNELWNACIINVSTPKVSAVLSLYIWANSFEKMRKVTEVFI